jgi:hypothetical protein
MQPEPKLVKVRNAGSRSMAIAVVHEAMACSPRVFLAVVRSKLAATCDLLRDADSGSSSRRSSSVGAMGFTDGSGYKFLVRINPNKSLELQVGMDVEYRSQLTPLWRPHLLSYNSWLAAHGLFDFGMHTRVRLVVLCLYVRSWYTRRSHKAC